MMVKEFSGLFKIGLVFSAFFFLFSCQTTPIAPKEVPPQEEIVLPVSSSTLNSTGAFQDGLLAELSSPKVVSGSIVVVKLSIEPALETKKKATPLITGTFEGIELPFFEMNSTSQFNSVLGIPYERKAGPGVVEVNVKWTDEQQKVQIPIQIIDGHYPSETLHVDAKRVFPSKKDLARILREQSEIVKIYRHITPVKYWTGPFLLPLESIVTSPFGSRRIFNGALKNFHPGIDFKAAEGTPIYASARGRIVLAKNLFYTGNTVMIDHGFGIVTIYAHLSRFKVKKGQIVEAHELLGFSGRTGRVNGPHLHWQSVVNHVKVNPMGLVQVVQ